MFERKEKAGVVKRHQHCIMNVAMSKRISGWRRGLVCRDKYAGRSVKIPGKIWRYCID
jgi:hypothetical protein